MRDAIGLRGETTKLLKDTGITMARLAEVWGVRPNQARKTYHKLYDWKAYNAKARSSLEKKHAKKRKAAKENGEEYCPEKKYMKGDSVITD